MKRKWSAVALVAALSMTGTLWARSGLEFNNQERMSPQFGKVGGIFNGGGFPKPVGLPMPVRPIHPLPIGGGFGHPPVIGITVHPKPPIGIVVHPKPPIGIIVHPQPPIVGLPVHPHPPIVGIPVHPHPPIVGLPVHPHPPIIGIPVHPQPGGGDYCDYHDCNGHDHDHWHWHGPKCYPSGGWYPGCGYPPVVLPPEDGSVVNEQNPTYVLSCSLFQGTMAKTISAVDVYLQRIGDEAFYLDGKIVLANGQQVDVAEDAVGSLDNEVDLKFANSDGIFLKSFTDANGNTYLYGTIGLEGYEDQNSLYCSISFDEGQGN